MLTPHRIVKSDTPMPNSKEEISIFKPYLTVKSDYVGGKPKPATAPNQKIYKLSSNENLLGSSPKAIAAIREKLLSLNEYPSPTDARLCEALATFYKGELPATQFMGANSGSELLEMIARAFLDVDLECIISSPTFMPYCLFAEKQGAKVVDVPLKGDRFDLDVEGILAAITPRTRLLFLTTPNNPTGSYLPAATMKKLIEALPSHVVTVVDEVYYQFTDAADYSTAMPFVKAGKRVIAINSFSKAYGLAGLRVGYAYSTSELISYVKQLHRPFLLNSLSLSAAIAALEDVDFITQTVELIQTEKWFLYPQLDELKIKYWPTQGNFFLMRPPVSPPVFEAKMLEQGVMVRPVENFGAKGCIRITIGTREANEALVRGLRTVYTTL